MQKKCARMIRHWTACGRLIGLLALALLWQADARAQSSPPSTVLWVNCGGEGEPPCGKLDPNLGWGLLPADTPTDGTTTNINDSVRCDKGLQLHFTGTGQVCLRANRLTVGEINDNRNPPWLAFARQNQYDVIQADQTLTYNTIFASHNSYSNYFDGSQSQFSADQGFDITDQLQYGARLIRLDPWLFANTDGQIKLCHSSTITENIGKASVTIDALTLCAENDPLGKAISLNRSFIFAIKEIAHWLRLHPNEFVVIRLHDSGQHWSDIGQLNGVVSNNDGSPNAHTESVSPTSSSFPYYAEAISHELAGMLYMNPNPSDTTIPSDFRFPSLRQLRAMGKQAIVLSTFQSPWAFPADDHSGMLSVQYSPDQLTPALCDPSQSGSVAAAHSPTTFAENGEDRTLSMPYPQKMVDAPRLKGILACGFNEVGLDFLGTLDQAPNPHLLLSALSPFLGFLGAISLQLTDTNFQCDDFSQGNNCSTVDTRRETSIWSWGPGQGTIGQPVMMSAGTPDSFGSWFSAPDTTVANYLCAGNLSGSTFPDGAIPDAKGWYITNAHGNWEGGESACQTEKGAGWHFWHPADVLQNIAAWNTLHNLTPYNSVWTNYYAGNLQALPQTLSFTTEQGTVPPAQTIVATGGLGGALTVLPGDSKVTVTSVPLFSPRTNAGQANDNNDSGTYSVAITSQAANLLPGNYTSFVRLSENTTYNSVGADGGIQPLSCCLGTTMVTVNLTVTPVTTKTVVTSNPPGLIVFVDGQPATTPATFIWNQGTTHTVDDTQPAYFTDLYQASCTSWSDGGQPVHMIAAPATNTTLTANCQQSWLLLLDPIGPGSITANGTGGQGYYPAGSTVDINAVPQTGDYFTGYSGSLSGTVAHQQLLMNAFRNVHATFQGPAQVHIGGPAGITVAVDGTGYTPPVDFQWVPNSSHTLAVLPTAPLSAGRRLTFQQWNDGNLQTQRTVTAVNGSTFAPTYATQDLVTTSVNPPGSGQITAPGWVAEGATIQFTATANGGYGFSSFSGALSGSANPQTLTISGPVTVTANFAPASPRINVTAAVIADTDPSFVNLNLTLNNTGLGAAAPLNVTIAATPVSGSGVLTVPASVPTIANLQAGASTSFPLTCGWPASVTRIRLTVTFTAENGAYQGSQVLNVFR